MPKQKFLVKEFIKGVPTSDFRSKLSKREFKKIGKILNQKFFFIGHSIFSDPFLISSRIRKLFKIKKDFETKHQKKQIGTFLDKYFASITAISEK